MPFVIYNHLKSSMILTIQTKKRVKVTFIFLYNAMSFSQKQQTFRCCNQSFAKNLDCSLNWIFQSGNTLRGNSSVKDNKYSVAIYLSAVQTWLIRQFMKTQVPHWVFYPKPFMKWTSLLVLNGNEILRMVSLSQSVSS